MRRLPTVMAVIAALILSGCNASGKSDGTGDRDTTVYAREVSGAAVELFETVTDTPSLYARVAPVMTRRQLAALDSLVVQGSVTGAVLGYALPSDTAALNRLMSEPAIAGAAGPDVRLMWGAVTEKFGETDVMALYALRTDNGRPIMDGHIVRRAALEKEPSGDYWQIVLTLTPEAAERFAAVTRDNIGRQIAVAIGGKVVMAPFVRDEITGGRIAIAMPGSTRRQCLDLIDAL